MHNLYIKIDGDGQLVDHPVLGDNLKQVLEVSYLSDEVLSNAGYIRFENPERDPIRVVENEEYIIREDGVATKKYTYREITREEKLDIMVRSVRDIYLLRSDWTQTLDSPLTDKKKADWAKYRQALRDITDTVTDIESPDDVKWPTPPTK